MLTVNLVGTGEKRKVENLTDAKRIIYSYISDRTLLCTEVVDEEGEVVYFVDVRSPRD